MLRRRPVWCISWVRVNPHPPLYAAQACCMVYLVGAGYPAPTPVCCTGVLYGVFGGCGLTRTHPCMLHRRAVWCIWWVRVNPHPPLCAAQACCMVYLVGAG